MGNTPGGWARKVRRHFGQRLTSSSSSCFSDFKGYQKVIDSVDVVLIASRLPNAVCVIKAALLDKLLFGAAARLAGYIRNDAPLEMVLQARAELRDGAQLVIFPEGSRTAVFPIDAFAPGTALIAWRAAMPTSTRRCASSSTARSR